MLDDIPSAITLIKDIGGYGALILVLFGLRRRWWVPGWVYDDSTKACAEAFKKLETDRDWWREKFMVIAGAVERTRT